MPDKTGKKQAPRDSRGRFVKGKSGNPQGRPRGSRHKATLLAQQLLAGEVEELTRKLIDLAKEGDMDALRLIFTRMVPPAKDAPVQLQLPEVDCADNLVKAHAQLLAAVAAGEITPSQGRDIAGLVEVMRRVIELEDLERRVRALEEC